MKHILITIAAVVLLGCGPSMSIHKAAKTGNIEVIKQHLAAGTDVNAKGRNGWAPLHRVAIWGHKEIDKEIDKETVELLIAKGADVNAKDKYGDTPLDAAITRFRTEAANLLRKHGGKTGEELKAEGK